MNTVCKTVVAVLALIAAGSLGWILRPGCEDSAGNANSEIGASSDTLEQYQRSPSLSPESKLPRLDESQDRIGALRKKFEAEKKLRERLEAAIIVRLTTNGNGQISSRAKSILDLSERESDRLSQGISDKIEEIKTQEINSAKLVEDEKGRYIKIVPIDGLSQDLDSYFQQFLSEELGASRGSVALAMLRKDPSVYSSFQSNREMFIANDEGDGSESYLITKFVDEKGNSLGESKVLFDQSEIHSRYRKLFEEIAPDG